MSRLNSVIRRLCAQRDCLGWAVGRAPEGDFLEIGLGNGRTYDHLREIAPDRRILVIDRDLKAHPSCTPPPDDFLKGEADQQLSALAQRMPGGIALAHYDLGVGVPELDEPLRASLAPYLRTLLAPGGLLVTNGLFDGFQELPQPETVPAGRYYLLRKS